MLLDYLQSTYDEDKYFENVEGVQNMLNLFTYQSEFTFSNGKTRIHNSHIYYYTPFQSENEWMKITTETKCAQEEKKEGNIVGQNKIGRYMLKEAQFTLA